MQKKINKCVAHLVWIAISNLQHSNIFHSICPQRFRFIIFHTSRGFVIQMFIYFCAFFAEIKAIFELVLFIAYHRSASDTFTSTFIFFSVLFIIAFSIYRHPLFSLLALMLEKCEQATQGYIPKATSASPNGTNGNTDPDSFTKDIQAFVQMLEKENRPLLTNNAELDGLVSAIDEKYITKCAFPIIRRISIFFVRC